MTQTRVLIVGAGRLGQALAAGLQRGRTAAVSLWDSNPAVLPGSLPLPTLAHTAEVVLLAIPTSQVRPALSDLGLHVGSRTLFGLLSKGLEPDDGLTAAEIAEVILPKRRDWAVIGGPMVAEEMRSGVRGRAIVAGPGLQLAEVLEAVFPPEVMDIHRSAAPAWHVSLAGVLKNIYAVMYGLGVGLKWSPIELGALWRRCETELLVAGNICGIEPEVMSGLAGLEDWRATGGSRHSRNRQAGEQLATTGKIDQGAEGLQAAPLIVKRWPRLSGLEGLHGLIATLNAPRRQINSHLLRRLAIPT